MRFQTRFFGMQMLAARASGTTVYVCQGGRRFWVPDGGLLADYGIEWGRDVVDVSDEFIAAHRPGQILPRRWTKEQYSSPPPGLTSRQMREIAGAQLSGMGLELGALASPFPANIDCNVIYADFFSYAELLESYPNEPRDSLVIPTIKTQFETLDCIGDESLDFVIASHVIEHTRDPIGAIVNAYKKLRPGGKLVLVVPDKRRTFDRDRPITALDHLIGDYVEPSHERDKQHHIEFFTLAFPQPTEALEKSWRKTWEERYPIHYHTWVYETFAAMVEWIRKCTIANFADCWSQPTLPHEVDDFEFYFVLTKGRS